MQLQHSFVFNILSISNLIRQNVESAMQQINLHSSQVFVLEMLWEADGMSQADIAGKMQVSPPTVNKMVNSLEKSGFLKRDVSKFDRRAVRLKLTKKGKEIRPEVYEIWHKLESKFLAGLTETENVLLTMQLEKLKEKLLETRT